ALAHSECLELLNLVPVVNPAMLSVAMTFPYPVLLSFLAANLLAATGDENWETFSIPKGLNGEVVRLLACRDLLYAAGNFTEADGERARGIAAWNGSHWSAVGRGLEGSVFALATD